MLFFFQAEDGIRDDLVTGVQTCALPISMCGTTAIHFACSNTSSGIPLSGIAIISCNTLPAFSSRSVASSRADAAQHSVPRLNIASKDITFFMEQPHFCPNLGDRANRCVPGSAQFRVGSLGRLCGLRPRLLGRV